MRCVQVGVSPAGAWPTAEAIEWRARAAIRPHGPAARRGRRVGLQLRSDRRSGLPLFKNRTNFLTKSISYVLFFSHLLATFQKSHQLLQKT
jgi:hypothetical protein